MTHKQECMTNPEDLKLVRTVEYCNETAIFDVSITSENHNFLQKKLKRIAALFSNLSNIENTSIFKINIDSTPNSSYQLKHYKIKHCRFSGKQKEVIIDELLLSEDFCNIQHAITELIKPERKIPGFFAWVFTITLKKRHSENLQHACCTIS